MNPLVAPITAPLTTPAGFESQLAAYSDLVVPLMLQAVPDREPRRHLYDLIQGYLSGTGKGLRPALCIATCRAFGGSTESVLPSAAALELLHNALLVHDDIEDDSDYRRDKPTMHKQIGVPLAVNAGDALNAMSVRMLRQNLRVLGSEQALQIFGEFDHMSIETIEGQAMELGWIRDNACDTREEDYLLMVLKKTCWYSFIHPCRIGALVAGRDPASLGAFDAFGYFLGVAFQIQDDVLNLIGDRKRYGKEINGDLLEGKRTLIVAHTFGNCSAYDKDRLRTFFAKPRAQRLPREVAWVRQLLKGTGSIDYASGVARAFASSAQSEFDKVYANAPGTMDVEFLRSLVGYMIRRDV
ncbi:MAG: polyprenyl synthetase family protein [Polyangiaceae bacterium]